MGEWMRKNGESIYGTRGGPIPPRHWGVTTHKGSRVYLHALEPEDGLIAAPSFGKEIVSAKLLDGGAAVRFEKQDWGWLVFLPQAIQDPTDTIVVLETR
jgi:alpha-L-fucosidase